MEPTTADRLDILSRQEQHQLVKSHDGLAIKIATQFARQGLSVEDMIQEGRVGLVIAARRFNPERKLLFITYASWWVRACVLEYIIRSSGPIRVGSTGTQRKIFFRLGRARRQLMREGRTDTAEAIAEKIGVPIGDVELMLPRMSRTDVSLDADRSDEGPALAERLSATPIGISVDDDDWQAKVLTRARKLVAGMGRRYKRVFELRFLREEPWTLRRIGDELGVSRERVRQIEVIVLSQLRKGLKELEV